MNSRISSPWWKLHGRLHHQLKGLEAEAEGEEDLEAAELGVLCRKWPNPKLLQRPLHQKWPNPKRLYQMLSMRGQMSWSSWSPP